MKIVRNHSMQGLTRAAIGNRPLIMQPSLRGGVIVLVSTLFLAISACTSSPESERLVYAESQIKTLKEQVRRLSYNTASGGGVIVKMMPDPVTGELNVPMEGVFSFDRNHAVLRVDGIRKAFKLRTFELGDVVVEPNDFFMSMIATTVDQYVVETLPNGNRKVTMRGGLTCHTDVGKTTIDIGSHTTHSASEHATYLIEAVDGGIDGGHAGDSFAITAFFDHHDDPVNYSIFGPQVTFSGQITEGEITIIDPRE